MSASLVGSEMCIRDRRHPGMHHARTHHARTHAACEKSHKLSLLPKAGPVSYTHLTLPTICSV
eukprot:11511465-Alexandrium_andersonii.AAC.1